MLNRFYTLAGVCLNYWYACSLGTKGFVFLPTVLKVINLTQTFLSLRIISHNNHKTIIDIFTLNFSNYNKTTWRMFFQGIGKILSNETPPNNPQS